MGRDIPKEYKINRVRGALQYFSTHMGKVDLEETKKLKSIFTEVDNYVIYADEATLSKIGMLLALRNEARTKNSSIRLETFDDMVSGNYADSYEIAQDYKSCKHPLLFVYVNKLQPLLSKNEPYLIPIFNNRHMNGLKTVVLCEIPDSLVNIQELGYMKRFNLFKGSKATTTEEDNAKKISYDRD